MSDPAHSTEERMGAAASLDEERLVWIFGSSRSGSTWLLRMLASHPGVLPIDDPHIGHHIGLWRPLPLAWATADESPELTTLPQIKGSKPDYLFSERYRRHWLPALRRFICARFGPQIAEQAGARAIRDPVVVIKEPGSQVADLLTSMFPRSGMVFLLRDGRDVVASWLDAYGHGSWALDEGAYPLSAAGRLPFIRWQASVWVHRIEVVQRAFAAHDPGRRALLRYEDLKDDPASSLGDICRRFGIETSASLLESITGAQSYGNVPPLHRGNGKAIRWAEPGRWSQELDREEVEAMMEILGPKLAELGYPEEPAHPTPPPRRPLARR